LKAENQLKFQQHSALAQRVRTTVKLPRRKTPDFIIEPNPWLYDITGVDMSTSCTRCW